MIQSSNVVQLRRFMAHTLPKNNDISTSTIDKFSQITKSDETACCLIDEPSESPPTFSSSATAAAIESPYHSFRH